MSIERIKFRAQNPRTKKWETVESFAEYWPNRPRETHAERLALFFDSCNGVNLDPATVGQWTGLVDSKGVEIWEGDVIESGSYSGMTAVVVFENGQFTGRVEGRHDLSIARGWSDTVVVIGNVHEVTT